LMAEAEVGNRTNPPSGSQQRPEQKSPFILWEGGGLFHHEETVRQGGGSRNRERRDELHQRTVRVEGGEKRRDLLLKKEGNRCCNT